MINQDYDFVNNVPEDVQSAFLDFMYRVVDVPAGTELYKLSSYGLRLNQGPDAGLSAWWSTVRPFRDDTVGMRGRYLEAALNQIPFAQMVRFASAVRGDWNALGEYQEIMLLEPARGLWGQYTPQPIWSPSIRDQDAVMAAQSDLNQSIGNLPGTLGGNDAWQLWIPNLTINDVEVRHTIAVDNAAAMAARFNLL
jgi:hypothetical protein